MLGQSLLFTGCPRFYTWALQSWVGPLCMGQFWKFCWCDCSPMLTELVMFRYPDSHQYRLGLPFLLPCVSSRTQTSVLWLIQGCHSYRVWQEPGNHTWAGLFFLACWIWAIMGPSHFGYLGMLFTPCQTNKASQSTETREWLS